MRVGALRLDDCHSDGVEGLGKRWVEKGDHSETRPRTEGSGCMPLAMGRGAGCRGEARMVSGLRVGRWKRENARKGGWWNKGIESTREGMREACKIALVHNGVNSRAGARCAEGQEMAFDEEVGVVRQAKGSAVGRHLHRGEQRWTLDGRPLKERGA